MSQRRSGWRLAVGMAIVAAGIAVPGAAQADPAVISFDGSVAEIPRGAVADEGLVVSIDEATAEAHPDATMMVRPDHEIDGWEAIGLSGREPATCRGGGQAIQCDVNPRGWDTQTRWPFGLRSLEHIPAEGTTFIAELVEGGETVAAARHTVAVGETETWLRTWTETVSIAPGQTASFTPSFANLSRVPAPVAGVVVTIVGDATAVPVADYDNCVRAGRELTCVVPAIALSSGDTVAVAAETPLGLRLDEDGPYDEVCSACFQFARAVGVAEARLLLDRLGGSETGNVLELVAADRPDRDPDPEPNRDPNLIVDVVS